MTVESGTSHIQAFDIQKLMLSFEGRTRRSHFWIGWLILLGAGVVANWIPFIGFLISIALIWPNLAITAKRLHDMGLSGWFMVIPWVLNVVGVVFIVMSVGMSAVFNAAALESEDPAAIMALLGPLLGGLGLLFLVNLGFLLWIGLTDSRPGSNRFGPNPKGL